MSAAMTYLRRAASTMAAEQKREAERATRRHFELGEYLARKMVADPALRERVAVDMNAECTRTATRTLFELDAAETWFDKLESSVAVAASETGSKVRSRRKDAEPSQAQVLADTSGSQSQGSKTVAPGPLPTPQTKPLSVGSGSGNAKAPPTHSDSTRAS